jgi:hypothetical protein
MPSFCSAPARRATRRRIRERALPVAEAHRNAVGVLLHGAVQ